VNEIIGRVEVLQEEPRMSTHALFLRDTLTGDHFIASGTNAMFSGWEVLVFPATPDGDVEEWLEVAGGRGISHMEAIEDLNNWLNGRDAHATKGG
jgi:hypothetical protein